MEMSEGNVMGARSFEQQEKGFTLLEVIIAMFILAFGLLAIASMQTTAIKGNSEAMGITGAATFAQDRMERLLSLAYTHADLNDTDADGLGGLNHSTTATADHNWTDSSNTYTVYCNVAVDQPIQNVKTIRMIVRWTDRGVGRTATFEFMKSEVI
jgi:type IV pilus assembly protein PilV